MAYSPGTFTIYKVECKSQDMEENTESGSGLRDRIFTFLTQSILNKRNVTIPNEQSRRAIKIIGSSVNVSANEITGFLEYGQFGNTGEIENLENRRNIPITEDDAVLTKYYFLLTKNFSIRNIYLVTERKRNIGVEVAFGLLVKPEDEHHGFSCGFSPVVAKEIIDAMIRDHPLKVLTFEIKKAPSTIEETVAGGDDESEPLSYSLVLKPEKGKNLTTRIKNLLVAALPNLTMQTGIALMRNASGQTFSLTGNFDDDTITIKSSVLLESKRVRTLAFEIGGRSSMRPIYEFTEEAYRDGEIVPDRANDEIYEILRMIMTRTG
ncbi:MAG: hypothetical protein QXU18_12020 [Thermoplasmatales archaeon]